ncbi:MAG: UDP-N-acetylmuramate--L-alanine ligase [Candidatus Doudnabacteria bacterium]
MQLENVEKIYFIGIGGIAMSATACMAKQMGYQVVGSDSTEVYAPAKTVLDDHNIPYFVGYDTAHIKDEQADLYIASAGESSLTNPEIAWLESETIEFYSLSEFLYQLSKDKLRIVVSGTHGKSTTAALLGRALQEIDDSSFMTGAVLIEDEVNFYQGDGHYYVFEGDEYKALYNDPTPKFHQYKPDILLLNNLEMDHPDIFSSLEELENEFAELIENMPDDGLLVYNADQAELAKLAHQSNLGQVTFGLNNNANYVASNIQILPEATQFIVTKTGPQDLTKVSTETYAINLFGEHNVYNALGAIAVLRTLGFTPEQVQHGLAAFAGIKRRLEFLGQSKSGAMVFDDYAHHPTAVKETLKALKARYPQKRLWAVFEPHTFSRTQSVLTDLATCFDEADQVLIAEIYPAREKASDHSITGQIVVDKIKISQSNVRLVVNKEAAQQILDAELTENDVVVVMAVGSFNRLGYQII